MRAPRTSLGIAPRASLAWLCAAALLASGGTCGGGNGSEGRGAVVRIETPAIENPDGRCAALPEAFPPGFSLVPGLPGRIVAASLGVTQTLVPFDVETTPPAIADDAAILGIPLDSDGDGRSEGVPGGVALAPVLDDVFAVDADLGFATASGYEEVIFFRPASGELRELEVEVPASLPPGDRPFLPAPGTAALRTALSTFACVRVPEDSLDSRGDPVAESVRAPCDPDAASFRTSFTSGVAVAAGRLFVTTSNLGADRGTPDTQYLPGSVLVFELDRSLDPPRLRPDPVAPVLLTSGFNPTHVSAHRVGDRELVLVTLSGALGIAEDDPDTKPVEGAGIPRSEAAIDVFDAETLVHLATIPLGLAALAFDGPAIDPAGRMALIGSAAGRVLYGVDLAPLADLPAAPAEPVRLDEAVIFDAARPFRIPGLAAGAPPESCPGETFGVAFDHTGERVYVGDFCDGSLALIGVDRSGAPDTAALRERFLLLDVEPLVAPLRADTLGEPRGLGRIAVRPGRPGIDFQGPEVFFLVGQEEGLLCGISVAPR